MLSLSNSNRTATDFKHLMWMIKNLFYLHLFMHGCVLFHKRRSPYFFGIHLAVVPALALSLCMCIVSTLTIIKCQPSKKLLPVRLAHSSPCGSSTGLLLEGKEIRLFQTIYTSLGGIVHQRVWNSLWYLVVHLQGNAN